MQKRSQQLQRDEWSEEEMEEDVGEAEPWAARVDREGFVYFWNCHGDQRDPRIRVAASLLRILGRQKSILELLLSQEGKAIRSWSPTVSRRGQLFSCLPACWVRDGPSPSCDSGRTSPELSERQDRREGVPSVISSDIIQRLELEQRAEIKQAAHEAGSLAGPSAMDPFAAGMQVVIDRLLKIRTRAAGDRSVARSLASVKPEPVALRSLLEETEALVASLNDEVAAQGRRWFCDSEAGTPASSRASSVVPAMDLAEEAEEYEDDAASALAGLRVCSRESLAPPTAAGVGPSYAFDIGSAMSHTPPPPPSPRRTSLPTWLAATRSAPACNLDLRRCSLPTHALRGPADAAATPAVTTTASDSDSEDEEIAAISLGLAAEGSALAARAAEAALSRTPRLVITSAEEIDAGRAHAAAAARPSSDLRVSPLNSSTRSPKARPADDEEEELSADERAALAWIDRRLGEGRGSRPSSSAGAELAPAPAAAVETA
eukprot:tig00021037_g17469.t1